MKKFAWALMLPLVAVAASRDDYASHWPLACRTPTAARIGSCWIARCIGNCNRPPAGPGRGQCAGQRRWRPPCFLPMQPLAQAGAKRRGAVVPVAGRCRRAVARHRRDQRESPPMAACAGSSCAVPAPMQGATGDGGFVVDVSQLRGAARGVALHLVGRYAHSIAAIASAPPMTSEQWRDVDAEARVVQLLNNGQRIVEDRIALPPCRHRYLRLLPHRRKPPRWR